ncbi:MAG: class III signal peptide-containing protein [archaeon]
MLSEKKGQIAIEYMLLIGLATIISISGLAVIGNFFQNELDDRNRDILNDFAFSLQNELILASQVEEGYIRIIYLPDDIEGVDYSILVDNAHSIMTLTDLDTGMSITLLIPEITGGGGFTKGIDNTITNKGGYVQIN